MFSFDFLIFLFPSLVTVALIFFKVKTAIILQAVALLLIILLLLSKRFIFSRLRVYNLLFTRILIVLSSLFVQLLVISTGGFYSPFLILVHLYTLGTSFLLKLSPAISFLIFSVVVLIMGTFLNQTLLTVFRQDPATIALYLISFLVILPLASYLTSTYHLKDSISRILTENLEVGEKREQSILQGLNELVIVTDSTLKIISFNAVAEKHLKVPGEISGSQFLGAISIKDENGRDATLQSLSIDKVLENKITYVVEDFYLETKSGRMKVMIQIKPIMNLSGAITQIAFVITEARISGLSEHADLEAAKRRQETIVENFKKTIKTGQLSAIEVQAELALKIEEDLMIAQELEDHPFRKVIGFQDLVEICQQAIVKREPFAKCLKVSLQFILPKGEIREAAYLDLKKNNLSALVPLSDFSVPTDPKWFKVILEKLIDMSMLLSLGQPNPSVSLSLAKVDDQNIVVSVGGVSLQLSRQYQQELFKEYYGILFQRTNLKLGSGLEGFIAKLVADELGISIEVETDGANLSFKLRMTKNLKV